MFINCFVFSACQEEKEGARVNVKGVAQWLPASQEDVSS